MRFHYFQLMTPHAQADVPNSQIPVGYLELLDEIKREVAAARVKTALAVNSEMVALYWRIGRHIHGRQADEGWGRQVVKRLEADLKTTYPQAKGFSRTNLLYMRKFALTWPEFVPQAVGQNPMGSCPDAPGQFP